MYAPCQNSSTAILRKKQGPEGQTYRYLSQKRCDVVNVLREKFVQGVHVRLLRAEEDVVCKVLYDLGDEKKTSSQVS